MMQIWMFMSWLKHAYITPPIYICEKSKIRLK